MLSNFSVKKPMTIFVSVVLIIMLGVVSFLNMSTDLLPSMDLPYAVAYTSYVGASPEQVEQNVTKPLEAALSTTSGVKNINSVSQENVSMVIMEFEQGVNMDSAMIEMSGSLDRVRDALPDGAGSPALMKLNPNMLPVMVLAVDREDTNLTDLSAFVKDTLSPALERVDGVATVSGSGLVENQLRIRLDQSKIDALNDRVLASVDKSLAEAQQKLRDGRQEIEDGKKKLEDESGMAYSKLIAATQQLSQAQIQAIVGGTMAGSQMPVMQGTLAQLSAKREGMNQLYTSYTSTDAAVKSALGTGKYALLASEQTQRTAARKSLADAQSALSSAGSNLAAIDAANPTLTADLSAARQTAEAAKTAYDAAVPGSTEQSKLKTEWEGAEAYLAQLQSKADSRAAAVKTRDDASAAADAASSELAAIETKMTALGGGDPTLTSMLTAWVGLQDAVSQAGFGSIAEVKAAMDNLDQVIAKTGAELAAAGAAQQQVKAGVASLTDAQGQLEQGKIAAMSGILRGTVEMDMAEKQLDTAQEQFDKQRDEAYKKAGLDGVITQATVARLLTAQNFSMPAGYINTGSDSKSTVKVGDQFTSVEELSDWIVFSISAGDIGDIRLSDVAAIGEENNADDLYAKINGNDGVLLTVQKSSVASTSAACDNLHKAIDELSTKYPGLHITPLSDQGQYINLVVGSVIENLAMGAFLAVVVLMFFLKDFRPTIVVALSIPISLMLAVVLMYFTNITLNIISLSGLALGVGMLVDNSIVAIENVYRLRKLGYSAATAAVQGCRQIAGAIAASTLTTVCVFLPILFTHGLTRELFADMGLTIAYSLGASLLVALTLVPAMSSKILVKHGAERENRFLTHMIAKYRVALGWTLRHKAPVLVAAVGLLVLSGVLAASMGSSFMPEMDSPEVSVTMKMPQGATQKEARAMSNQVLDRILTVDGVQTVGAMEGGAAAMSGMSGMAGGDNISLYVLLAEKRESTSQQIAAKIEEATADLDCTVTASGSTMDMASMMGGSGIKVAVTGDDLDVLRTQSDSIKTLLQNIEGVKSVSDGRGETNSETRVSVDKNKASQYGLTVAQVYQQIAAALTTQTEATHITIENSDLPVIVVPSEDALVTRDTLSTLKITGTKDGESKDTTLSEIASINDAQSASAISRENQVRTVTLTAEVAEGYNIGLVSRSVTEALQGYSMPDGYAYTIGGESQTISSTMTDLVKMILLAVALIYLIMVAQFQSLLSPFIVLFTIPLAFTGGLLALWITGKDISVVSMLGFLVLAGIIVNNGIVFVDYANQLRLEGMEKREALLQTGSDRIRPILMTALTTIFGLVTMALGMGTGGDMLQPLAIVTIGGLTYATVLTLFVVPAMYDLMHRRPLRKVEIGEVDEV